MYTYYFKFGIAFLAIAVVLAPYVGEIKAKANLEYQTFADSDIQYAIIVDYNDKVLVQRSKEENDVLTIYADSYSYVSKEDLSITYKKYEEVIINKEQNNG